MPLVKLGRAVGTVSSQSLMNKTGVRNASRMVQETAPEGTPQVDKKDQAVDATHVVHSSLRHEVQR